MRYDGPLGALRRHYTRLTQSLNFAAYAARPALTALSGAGRTPPAHPPHHAMGLTFRNPIGIAAGFDRRGLLAPYRDRLGFGHIELGTLCRYPQPGAYPGISTLARLRRHPSSDCPLGINIGLNPGRNPAQAQADLLYCQRVAWRVADYLCLNLGNANARWLLQPEHEAELNDTLRALTDQQRRLSAVNGRAVPLVVKLVLDLERPDRLPALPPILPLLPTFGIAGVVLALDRGKPVTAEKIHAWRQRTWQDLACELTRQGRALLGADTALIVVGGIGSEQDIRHRLNAGADLVQVHNGLLHSRRTLLDSLAKPYG
ncbi:hypothetical protein KQ940_05580 [Marinobacterium sp. D7]|uniref:hypothetical protein n=1 Tax=Marinobacterium ramblicola TaxID=2849041 RepID=UPI001C2CCE53|nr:hypothetical protein [Marinobacterium ramblicola]MBV1787523.1 hypothetical protein [Marinobacterium ramblicola]